MHIEDNTLAFDWLDDVAIGEKAWMHLRAHYMSIRGQGDRPAVPVQQCQKLG